MRREHRKTGHVLVRTSHSRGQPKGQRFQSSKSAMSGGLKFYSLYEALWPLETDLLALLPKPDGVARAVSDLLT